MLKTKTIWILGSNSDIAKTFVKKYGAEFGSVVLASRNFENVKLFEASLNLQNTFSRELDISDLQSIDAFVENTPQPDIILLLAGHILFDSNAEVLTAENIQNTFRTNVEGPAILLERVSGALRGSKGATVIAVSSCAGERGKGSNRIYSASKSALTSYLEGFMQANEQYGIKTVIVKLGHADTKMLYNIPSEKHMFSCSSESVANFIFKNIRSARSREVYFRHIWKPLSFMYKLIPLSIYKKLKF